MPTGTLAASVDSFLERVAAPTPEPGGGAVAALAGAAAAALLAMACGITARREPGADVTAALVGADTGWRRLAEMVDADAAAYRAVLAAEQGAGEARVAAVRAALREAIAVPMAVAEAGAAILDRCAAVAEVARSSTLGDLGVAGVMAKAAVEAGALTARLNLAGLDAPEFVADTRRRLAGCVERATGTWARLTAVLERRTG